jgi:hypothetical protein
MEVPNEDMKDAYKKVFGCEIHKDPELAKFFESEQLEEVHPAFQGGKLPLTRTADGTPEKTGQSKNSLVGKKIPVSKNASTKTNYGIGRK